MRKILFLIIISFAFFSIKITTSFGYSNYNDCRSYYNYNNDNYCYNQYYNNSNYNYNYNYSNYNNYDDCKRYYNYNNDTACYNEYYRNNSYNYNYSNYNNYDDCRRYYNYTNDSYCMSQYNRNVSYNYNYNYSGYNNYNDCRKYYNYNNDSYCYNQYYNTSYNYNYNYSNYNNYDDCRRYYNYNNDTYCSNQYRNNRYGNSILGERTTYENYLNTIYSNNMDIVKVPQKDFFKTNVIRNSIESDKLDEIVLKNPSLKNPENQQKLADSIRFINSLKEELLTRYSDGRVNYDKFYEILNDLDYLVYHLNNYYENLRLYETSKSKFYKDLATESFTKTRTFYERLKFSLRK